MTVSAQRFPPHLRLFARAEDGEAWVGDEIARLLRSRPESVLGLATGNSMRGVYRQLVSLHRQGALSFSAMTSFNLDEYCGVNASDPSSFSSFMHDQLFDRVDANPSRLHLPDSTAVDAAARYEALITAAGGIDLQVLGIGQNGHIGFNEPGSSPSSRTRIVDLAPRTRQVNAADFPSDATVPTKAITMGIATILEARRIILLATGAAKADALAQALHSPPSADNPASYLQTHPNVTIACDDAAAAHLRADAFKEKRHA